jgi:hypothetical protein
MKYNGGHPYSIGTLFASFFAALMAFLFGISLFAAFVGLCCER